MINITRNISAILEGGPGRAGTTPANTSVLSPMIPLIFFFLTASYMRHSCFDKVRLLLGAAAGTHAHSPLPLPSQMATLSLPPAGPMPLRCGCWLGHLQARQQAHCCSHGQGSLGGCRK